MKNLDDYYRKNREKSISPSISFDVSQNNNLTESEKREKNFYSATVCDMSKEMFTSLDDLLRNINFFLRKTIDTDCKKLTAEQSDKLFQIFLDGIMKTFTDSYDKGEEYIKRILVLSEEDEALSKYLKDKAKRRNLIPILSDKANDKDIFSPLKKFDEEKSKLNKNIKENIRLRIEIALEKRIQQTNSLNFEKIKDKFTFIEDQIKIKPNMSYIDKNIDIMANKLKIMKRELNQLD